MKNIYTPQKTFQVKKVESLEKRIASSFKTQIQTKIVQRKLSKKELAKKLNLPLTGVELLMNRDYWPVETCLQVAAALDLDVEGRLRRWSRRYSGTREISVISQEEPVAGDDDVDVCYSKV